MQILGCVGSRMRSAMANQLLLGIMIVQLDKEQSVRAVAAEVLQGTRACGRCQPAHGSQAQVRLVDAHAGMHLHGTCRRAPPCAAGVAEQRKAPLRELVCASQKFLAFLARSVRGQGCGAPQQRTQACLLSVLRVHVCSVACHIWLDS